MDKPIETIEQKTVLFYDDELVATRAGDGQIYVSVRHLCETLALDNRSQRRRIQNHAVLGAGYASGVITTPKGVKRTSGLLRVDLIPLWLSGIRLSRVKEDIRPKLERFQQEAAKVLWEAFQDGRLSVDPTFSELLKNDDNPSVQAYKMAQAIMRMAQQQILLEGRVDDHENRIEQLESIVGDTKHSITPSQASQISQAVKAIAMELSKQTGGNAYGGVYGELYRRFEITSYKLLPKKRFAEAMRFLTEWYTGLTGSDDVPF